MAYYAYFVRDYFSNTGNYPLKGAHYESLLTCCFLHSAYVSFIIKDGNAILTKGLEKWAVEKELNLFDAVDKKEWRKLYHACPDVHQAMLSWTDDLFELCVLGEHSLPEDPVFFRDDGTIFFESVIHEGECKLIPRNEENVNDVLRHGRWLYMNDNEKPEMPAKDYQLLPPHPNIIYSDPLFEELMEIKYKPLEYLRTQNVGEIMEYVSSYCPPFLRNARLPDLTSFSCMPKWYGAFEMYVLGKCDSLTSSDIPSALRQAGYRDKQGFFRFYELLDSYLRMAEELHNKEDTSL